MSSAKAPNPAMILAATGRQLVEELCRALAAAAGRPVEGAQPEVASLEAAEMELKLTEPTLAFTVELGGPISGKAAIILPGKAAAAISGLISGLGGDALAEQAAKGPSDSDIDALFGPISSALVGMAEKITPQIGGAPGMGLGDALVLNPGSAAEFLKAFGSGPYPAAEFQMTVEGSAGTAMIVFPRSLKTGKPEAAETVAGFAPDAAAAAAPGGAAAPADGGGLASLHPNILRILRLKLQVSVVVAEKEMDCEAILRVTPGTIIEFDKSSEQDLDLMVSGRKIGSGEVVIIGERFGIQLRHIEGVNERIRRMGGAK